MGLRLTNEADVRAVQRRLEAAGIVTRNQTNTRGCYALQTKVWVEDPDQNLWEVYIVKEDLPHGSAYGCRADSVDDLEDDGERRLVIYKGPFRELIDEDGRRFPRPRCVVARARLGTAASGAGGGAVRVLGSRGEKSHGIVFLVVWSIYPSPTR